MIKHLVVVETHPVQYHVPVYREVARRGVSVSVVYGSDFSIAGYYDREFGTSFAWDVDLTGGPHESFFLSRVKEGGPKSYEEVVARGLWRRLRRLHPDAILIPGYNTRLYYSAILYALWHRIPILVRAEAADGARDRGAVKSKIRDIVLSWFYRQCHTLLYIGDASQAHYRRLGVPDPKLTFSPYCVDTTPFQCEEAHRGVLRRSAREELQAGDSTIVMTYSGKLSARKGVHILIEAIKLLPADVRTRILLVCVGDGEERNALYRLSLEQPTVRMSITGFRNQTELSRYYHASDLFVLPSLRYETWGLVVNEALHHGIPCVVSTAVGCCRDLVISGVTGETVKTSSAQDLMDGLMRALVLLRDGVTGREKCREVVNEYSVAVAAKGIVSSLERRVTSTPRPTLTAGVRF